MDNATKYSKEEINIQISTLENDKVPQSALNVYQFPFEVCQPNLTSALLCGFQTCDRISDPPRLQQKVLDFLGIMWYIISSTFPAGNRRIIRIIYDMEVNNVR